MFKNLEIFDHHLSHAASTYYFSKFNSAYTLTIDGWVIMLHLNYSKASMEN